jgi:hypothetical protein
MKYPFLFMFVSMLLASFVLVLLTSAVLAEAKAFVDRKKGVRR